MTNHEGSADVASSVRRRLGARSALIAGFGALLILMGFICVDSLHTLAAFASNNGQIRKDFLYREQTLAQVRTSLYESGVIVRDYILAEADPAEQRALEAELRSSKEQTASALEDCVRTLPTGETKPFENLQQEMERYWFMVDPIFAMSESEKKKSGGAVLRNDVAAQHLRILAIAGDVSNINSDNLREADRRTTEVSAQFRKRLLVAVGITFGLGLILAVATIVYVGGLEKSVEDKYKQSQMARRDLQELSKRLVDTEERERKAISRELHDQVGQSLGALLLDVEALATLPDQGGGFRDGLLNIKRLAQTCVNEVRNMSLLLRPSMLDDLGLVAAVEWQAREISKRTGMLVETVDENVPDDLPEEHKICVYRIVQEALNNCSKHAGAKRAKVTLRRVPNQLQVIVEDDGKGFDAERVRGLGLIGMHERVSQLGGDLRVDSRAGRGTRVSADLPLPGD
ncbi:MAG: sensor histidine kinase [Candidatus Acidiferrales bacterium]